MIKILVINPVSTKIWDELSLKYLKSIAEKDTLINVRSLSVGPKSIESYSSRDEAAPIVISEVKKYCKYFDGIIINCFDDPGLEGSREVCDNLVLGIGETSLTVALMLGYRIAIISTGKNASLLYYKRAIELGIKDRVVYASGIEVPVLDLRKDINKVKEELIKEGLKAVKEFGADVIVLGCGGFIGMAKELEEKLGVPVIDPLPVTFKITEALLKLGLRHSRKYLIPW